MCNLAVTGPGFAVHAQRPQLGHARGGEHLLGAHLQVNGTTMSSAQLIAQYTSLQSVELQDNELTDLNALSALPHLTSLDASKNKLTEVNCAGRCPARMHDIAAAAPSSPWVDGRSFRQAGGRDKGWGLSSAKADVGRSYCCYCQTLRDTSGRSQPRRRTRLSQLSSHFVSVFLRPPPESPQASGTSDPATVFCSV